MDKDQVKDMAIFPYSEEEAISLAEEVFGDIPQWYLTNKQEIDKNREEQKEWTSKIMQQINAALEQCSGIRQ